MLRSPSPTRHSVVKCLLRLFYFVPLLLTLGCSKPPLQGYLEGEYINLAVNYSGILKELLISRGNEVKAGQLLFVLDSEPEASQLEQAKKQLATEQQRLLDLEIGQRNTILQAITAQRDQAAADLKLSTQNVNGYRILFPKGAIDKATLDQAEATYQHDIDLVKQYTANLAEAEQGGRTNAIAAESNAVAAMQANVTAAEWRLAQKSVYAPVNGRIFDTYYKVGEFVNSQQPVASLLAPSDIKLVFYIPEPRRPEIKIGQSVQFTCDNCKASYSAIINYISPQAEYTPPVIYSRESRTKLVYRVEATLFLDTAQRFYPGQPVDVYFND